MRVIYLLLIIVGLVGAHDDGMCTEPPKVEGGDCGGGSDDGHEHGSRGPFVIDVTATVHPDLPYW